MPCFLGRKKIQLPRKWGRNSDGKKLRKVTKKKKRKRKGGKGKEKGTERVMGQKGKKTDKNKSLQRITKGKYIYFFNFQNEKTNLITKYTLNMFCN